MYDHEWRLWSEVGALAFSLLSGAESLLLVLHM